VKPSPLPDPGIYVERVKELLTAAGWTFLSRSREGTDRFLTFSDGGDQALFVVAQIMVQRSGLYASSAPYLFIHHRLASTLTRKFADQADAGPGAPLLSEAVGHMVERDDGYPAMAHWVAADSNDIDRATTAVVRDILECAPVLRQRYHSLPLAIEAMVAKNYRDLTRTIAVAYAVQGDLAQAKRYLDRYQRRSIDRQGNPHAEAGEFVQAFNNHFHL
jgi:hypothetical protein